MVKLSKEGNKYCLVHRPSTGLQSRNETLESVLKKYTLVSWIFYVLANEYEYVRAHLKKQNNGGIYSMMQHYQAVLIHIGE